MTKYIKGSFGMVSIITVIASALLASQVYAYNTIDTQLDLGETNADVTDLQVFFKDNASIYPEGLVTGYFGTLSRNAVQRFQTQQGLVTGGTAATTGYGRVGPSTRDAINVLINGGGWSGGGTPTTGDSSAPAFSSVNQFLTTNSATFSWSTNENATAKIFYSTNPIRMSEGDINSSGFGALSGSTAVNDNLARTSQQVIISGLQANTTYYYVLVATDLSGNVSVWNPNGTFRTNQ